MDFRDTILSLLLYNNNAACCVVNRAQCNGAGFCTGAEHQETIVPPDGVRN
jgi:hypothetical protein